MIQNRVKRILREGGLALGTYVGGIADPQIVEIIVHAGFDAAFIDLEHTSFDLRDVQLMVMAAERMGIAPIVRTPGFDPAFILRLRTCFITRHVCDGGELGCSSRRRARSNMSILQGAPDKEMRPDRPVPSGVAARTVSCFVARLDHIDIWPATGASHPVRPGRNASRA